MTRNSLQIVLAMLLTTALGLTACGRKGPLERPPHAEKRAEGATGPDGKPSDRPQRPLIIDRLIR